MRSSPSGARRGGGDAFRPLALDQAVEALKRDPTHTVRARVADLTVGLRDVPDTVLPVERSAADAMREIWRWEGETYEELVALVDERQG